MQIALTERHYLKSILWKLSINTYVYSVPHAKLSAATSRSTTHKNHLGTYMKSCARDQAPRKGQSAWLSLFSRAAISASPRLQPRTRHAELRHNATSTLSRRSRINNFMYCDSTDRQTLAYERFSGLTRLDGLSGRSLHKTTSKKHPAGLQNP